MSTSEPEFNPEDFEGLQPAQTTIHNAELRKLRKEAREAQELKGRLAALERESLFAKAGIPTDDPAAKYFVKGYDGALDAESIKTAAIEARLLSPTSAAPGEIQGHQAAAAMASGANPPNANPDYTARLAELGKKTFAPADDAARSAHIAEIAALAKEAGAQFPIYPGQ